MLILHGGRASGFYDIAWLRGLAVIRRGQAIDIFQTFHFVTRLSLRIEGTRGLIGSVTVDPFPRFEYLWLSHCINGEGF